MRLRTVCLPGLALVVGALQGCVVPADWRGEQTICPVHNVELKSETRQVTYGTMGYREGYLKARREEFPFAESTVHGGCISGYFSPAFAVIRYCPACREAEKQWIEEHPWKKKSDEP